MRTEDYVISSNQSSQLSGIAPNIAINMSPQQTVGSPNDSLEEINENESTIDRDSSFFDAKPMMHRKSDVQAQKLHSNISKQLAFEMKSKKMASQNIGKI